MPSSATIVMPGRRASRTKCAARFRYRPTPARWPKSSNRTDTPPPVSANGGWAGRVDRRSLAAWLRPILGLSRSISRPQSLSAVHLRRRRAVAARQSGDQTAPEVAAGGRRQRPGQLPAVHRQRLRARPAGGSGAGVHRPARRRAVLCLLSDNAAAPVLASAGGIARGVPGAMARPALCRRTWIHPSFHASARLMPP